MDVDGRRRLGAQPGGLTSGFAVHLVVSYCVQTQVSCLAGNRPRYVSLVVFSPAAERSCDVLQPVGQRVVQRVVSCKRRFSLPVHAASVVKDLFLYVYSSFFHATTLFSALSSFCHFILHILLFIYIDTIIRNFSCLHARRFTRFFYRIYRLICRKIIYHLSRICRFIADLQFNIKTILYRDRPIL